MILLSAFSLAGTCVAMAGSDTPPEVASPRAVSSASRRFLVTGFDSAAAVSLAVAAEEAAARLEALLRRPLPFTRNQPVVLAGRRDDKVARGRVVKSQGWTDRGLAQELQIVNVEQVNQEDLLEALSGLLVNRYLAARQTPAQRRARVAEAPEWLSVGLAQNLYSSLRARNARLALKQWLDDQPLSASEILSFHYLPAGRWSEKAFCGALTDWLLSFPANLNLWDRLMDSLAAPAPVTAFWMAGILLGKEDPRELEKHWEIWIARQTQIKRMGEPFQTDPAREIEAYLTIRPEEWSDLEARELPETLTLSRLIEYRGEPWMPAVAFCLEAGLRNLGLGRDKDFQRVLNSYVAFFSALAPRKPPGLFGRWRRSRPGETVLRERLQAADRLLEEYRAVRNERIRFVDKAESLFAGGTSDIAEMLRRIPRSELQRYVDAAEETPSK